MSKINKEKNKIKTDLINGNQLVGKVIDNDPLIKECVDAINELPESNDIKKVIKIKNQISSGQYDFDKKIKKATEKLITESLSDNCISYPITD